MKIEFVDADAKPAETTALAVLAFEDGEYSPAAEALDTQLSGALKRAVAASRFKGSPGQIVSILAPAGVAAGRVLVVGAGKQGAFDAKGAESAGAYAFNAAKDSGSEKLLLMMPPAGSERQAHAAFGIKLAAYRFDKYRTTEKPEKKPSVKSVAIAVADKKAAATAYKNLSTLADAICYARDLVSEPANILYPEEYARRVQRAHQARPRGRGAGREGDEEARHGLAARRGAGQRAREPAGGDPVERAPRAPARRRSPSSARASCFDTGGISIKPAEGMEEMITDMAGSAAVVGAMLRAGRPQGQGQRGRHPRPGREHAGSATRSDPATWSPRMSGQTIEVINTDAEGRLVLADAVWYCQDRFKPKFMVDLATLTGAIVVALGKDLAGLFCNDETLAANLMAASDATGDVLWRMPLPDQYDKLIESQVADMKNIGPRYGGSITAAMFIKQFTNGLAWAHIDMASTAWRPNSTVRDHPERRERLRRAPARPAGGGLRGLSRRGWR